MNSTLFNMKLLSLTWILFFIYGCEINATSTLWKQSEYEKITYSESISHFLITTDRKKFVIIGNNYHYGDKYHYIFETDESLNNIIKWDNRKLFRARFNEHFLLSSSNEISGRYEIICDCANEDSHNISWLIANGFIITRVANKDTYVKKGTIKGKRYLSNDLSLEQYTSFNNKYEITIVSEGDSSKYFTRVALTPITLTLDGLAVIGQIALIVVVVPITIADFIMGHEPEVNIID